MKILVDEIEQLVQLDSGIRLRKLTKCYKHSNNVKQNCKINNLQKYCVIKNKKTNYQLFCK